MSHVPRPDIRPRRLAVPRIAPVTAGVARAGIAGTAAFAAASEATRSGDPSATPLPDIATDGNAVTGAQNPSTTQTRPAAPNGGFAEPPTVTNPRTSRGTGHASTGGSR